jgi:hypothetical protein
LFSGVPKERKPIDYTKKLPTDGRPLYLDAQATTPMVRSLRTLSDVFPYLCSVLSMNMPQQLFLIYATTVQHNVVS